MQRLKSKIVSQVPVEDQRSAGAQLQAPQYANGGDSRPLPQQEAGDGQGHFLPNLPPQQLQQLRQIQAQQQAFAARAGGPDMGGMRRPPGPWAAPDPVMARPTQLGQQMGPQQLQRQHQHGPPWGPKAVPLFPDITTGKPHLTYITTGNLHLCCPRNKFHVCVFRLVGI